MLRYARNLLIILAGFPLFAVAQCFNPQTTWVSDLNYVSRENGNSVYAYAETYITGDDAPYYQLYISTSLYRDTTLLASHTRDTAPIGQNIGRYYRRVLQDDGPGTYHMDSLSATYNPYCDLSEPPFCSAWNYLGQCVSYWDGTDHSNNLSVVRPTVSGVTAFWYLGGVLSDHGYYTQSTLTANAQGAPETPYWFLTAGSDKLQLGCNGCSGTQNLVTSIGHTAKGAFTTLRSKSALTGFCLTRSQF